MYVINLFSSQHITFIPFHPTSINSVKPAQQISYNFHIYYINRVLLKKQNTFDQSKYKASIKKVWCKGYISLSHDYHFKDQLQRFT